MLRCNCFVRLMCTSYIYIHAITHRFWSTPDRSFPNSNRPALFVIIGLAHPRVYMISDVPDAASPLTYSSPAIRVICSERQNHNAMILFSPGAINKQQVLVERDRYFRLYCAHTKASSRVRWKISGLACIECGSSMKRVSVTCCCWSHRHYPTIIIIKVMMGARIEQHVCVYG